MGIIKQRKLGALPVTAGVALVALTLASLRSQALRAAPQAPQAAPLDVVINEVAWGGTTASAFDEWIELYNNTSVPISLTGWTLTNTGSVNIALNGVIPAGGYYLLERTDDNTIQDITADQIYAGGLPNPPTADRLVLRSDLGVVVDTANGNGGVWSAGSGYPDYLSMERVDPAAADADTNWASNTPLIRRNGLDANGGPINGTPKQANSATSANLGISKQAPGVAMTGRAITYTLAFSNRGHLNARHAVVTDRLPPGVTFVGQDSTYPFVQAGRALTWQVGPLRIASGTLSLHYTVIAPAGPAGPITNTAAITSEWPDYNPANNTTAASVQLVGPAPDLSLAKAGPVSVTAGSEITYRIALSNVGWLVATGVRVTDTLPLGVTLVRQSAPYPLTQIGRALTWDVGDVLTAAAPSSWTLTGLLNVGWTGTLTNVVQASATVSEPMTTNNMARVTTFVAPPAIQALDVVINEVAWGGTAASALDEWIELRNNTDYPIDLSGWQLRAHTGTLSIGLSGVISAQGYYLIERTDDDTVSDIPADWKGSFGAAGLPNGGDVLTLTSKSGRVVDTANGDGGAWPAGSAGPGYYSMERINPLAPGTDANWASNSGVARCGRDAEGNPINGTPRAPNSALPALSADLRLAKTGPASAQPGQAITYTLQFSNAGGLAATGVRLTDTLPAGVVFITATRAPSQPAANLLVWQMDDAPPGDQPAGLVLTVAVAPTASGWLVNRASIATVTTETLTANNSAVFSSAVASALPRVLVSAVHYYGYDGTNDEAVQLTNVGTQTAWLQGWRLTEGSSIGLTLPGLALAPGQRMWATRHAGSFYAAFGFWPDCAVVPSQTAAALTGNWPGLANDSGGDVKLADASGQLRDRVLYGPVAAVPGDWQGVPVQPYTPTTAFARAGQILYRKLDEASGLPGDSDTAADWAQDRADPIAGRRVRYPGWDLEAFYRTTRVTQTAWLTVGVAPDNAFAVISQVIASAQHTLTAAMYSFEHAALAELLAARARAGVEVTLLLEGEPAGGLSPQEKWACQQVEMAGGECWFMANEPTRKIYDRYSYQHAKFILADGRRVALGSENLSPRGLPDDDKADGTAGQRGVMIVTDAPGVVERARQVWAADFDPAHHRDLIRWSSSDPLYGPPPAGFKPITTTGGTTYTVRFPQPLVLSDTFPFELIQSPENSLRASDSLLGLIGRAGPGDEIAVEQLNEPAHWGPAAGTPAGDPNVYLEALIAAAGRGARVYILLDSYFDKGDNAATRDYVEARRAVSPTLHANLYVHTGNPTALGIHNKMVLARLGGRGYVHAGSLNHGELAAKGNRELALQVQSDQAYAYLRRMFDGDWWRVYLPVVIKAFALPAPPVNHVVIGEVVYDAAGADIGREWIELYNPTSLPVSLEGWSLGDAVSDGEYASGRYLFPGGAVLPPGGVIVVAQQAADVAPLVPNFEFLLDPNRDLITVTNMVPISPTWEGFGLELGNPGDEVLLRDAAGRLVDALVWGTGNYTATGVLPHPGVSIGGHSLERRPAMYDTDDCSRDFFDRYPPDPGRVSNVRARGWPLAAPLILESLPTVSPTARRPPHSFSKPIKSLLSRYVALNMTKKCYGAHLYGNIRASETCWPSAETSVIVCGSSGPQLCQSRT